MTPASALANVLAWSGQVALVALVCAPLPRLLRLPAHVQYGFWRVVIVACLALPLVEPWRTVASAGLPASSSSVVALDRVIPLRAGASGGGTAWVEMVIIALAAGAVLRLVWVAIGWVRLQRTRAIGTPVSGETAADVSELASLIGASADVRWIPGLPQPATFGLRRPLVQLPDSLRERPRTIRRAVIAHELFHVQRRDALMVFTEELIRAMTWFHPAMWWLISRVRLAREGVVDELTVLLTGARQTYLDALLLLADEAPLASSAFSRRRQLFHRMLMISREVRMTSRRFVAASAILAFALVVTGWTAVAAFPLRKVEPSVAQNPPPPPPPPPARDAYRNPPPPPPPPPPAPQQVTWQSPDAADATHVGGHIKPPTRIHYVAPVYPEIAREARVQGTVIVEALLDRHGNVEEVHVLRSIPMFDDPAVDAVSQWKFTPVVVDGEAVPVIMTTTVIFSIQ
ncbi:MAG: TonB family protein [Vicinamibacterales bacterium]